MTGQTLGHYTLLEKIGQGGMGHVYRAWDERLEREVAIKVLPPGALASEKDSKRFRKEALALSKLNHPNIATVHDFDQQEGAYFLVMEFIPGQTLEQRLDQSHLPEKEIARLGLQLAEGLAAAHEHGILHRDLKPSNIRVTSDGRLKILDFGLAKSIGQLDESLSTESQDSIAGTLTYMAPEQVTGDKLDQRTDIYCLGEVLYEMATGKRPFQESQLSRLSDAILHQPIVPPRALNPKVSTELEHIIVKCLEKERENRYGSASDVAVDLRRLSNLSAPSAAFLNQKRRRLPKPILIPAVLILATLAGSAVFFASRNHPAGVGGAQGKIRSLAVLPLENVSRDASQEYFADGMTDVLISNMAKIGALRIISRTSTMQYKGSKKRLPEIARELNVDALVEGSVLRSGNRVRITAQLVQADDHSLWSDSYNRDVRDVLQLQGEVAQAIARQIQVTLTPEEQHRLNVPAHVSPEAYELYLQARYYWNKRTADDVKKAVDYFHRAIAQNPSDALAYAGLADCYLALGPALQALPSQEALTEARSAALKSIDLDPSLAEPHATLSQISLAADWDWKRAQDEIQAAIALNPNYATAHHWYGLFLGYQGRAQEARNEFQKARELDPLSPIVQANLAWSYYIARDYAHAIAGLKETADEHPDFWVGHWGLGASYVQAGDLTRAIPELQKAVQLSSRTPGSLSSLAYAYIRVGDRAKAKELLDELEQRAQETHGAAGEIAIIYAGLGNKDAALSWLERGFSEHSYVLLSIKIEPWFDPLRSEARFETLVKKVGLV